MWGISCSMYNLKHLKWGLQVPLTLLSHAQSEVEWRSGSRSARGCAMELGLFLLPCHCCLAPSSICYFGTYSCNDHEQSLIKLQRTLPRNQCVCMGTIILDFFRLWVRESNVCVCNSDVKQCLGVQVCKSVLVFMCMYFFPPSVLIVLFVSAAYFQVVFWVVCMCGADWFITKLFTAVDMTPCGCQKPYC